MNRPALFLFLLCFIALLLLHPGRTLTADSAVTLDTVRALYRGELSIPENLVARRGRDGKFYSKYGPALPLLSMPAYAFGALFDEDPPDPAEHRYGWGDRLALGTNQWVTALMVTLLFLIGRELGVPGRWSCGMAVLAGFSTLLLPYSVDYFTQPLAALGLIAAGYFLIRDERAPSHRNLALASASIGLAVLARMDMIAFIPGFFVWGWGNLRTRIPEQRRQAWLATLLPTLLCLLLLYGFDVLRWGHERGVAYSNISFTTPLIDSLPRFLFSPDLSLFVFAPVLFVSLAMLPRVWRGHVRMWFGIGLGSLTYTLLVSKFEDFGGGVCPGPRYLLVLVPLGILPLMAALGEARFRTRRMVAVLALSGFLGLALNGYAALVDYSQGPSPVAFWSEVLSGNFPSSANSVRFRKQG